MKKALLLLACCLMPFCWLSAQSLPDAIRQKQPAANKSKGITFDNRSAQVESIICGPSYVNPPVELTSALGDSFSFSFWFTVSDADLLGASAWDKENNIPMTLIEMRSADGRDRILLRMMKNRIAIAASNDAGKSWPGFDTSTPIEAHKWYFLTVTKTPKNALVYVNDVFAGGGSGRQLPAVSGLDRAIFGRMDNRRFLRGAIMAPRFYPGVLSLAQIQTLFKKDKPSKIAADSIGFARSVRVSYGDYPFLNVKQDELHPLIDQLHVGATVLPRPDNQPGKNILLGNLPRNLFGSRVALFQPNGVDQVGLPVYAGKTIETAQGSHYFSATHPDGTLYIYANGNHTPYGGENLIRYPLKGYGADGMPIFGDVETIEVDGQHLTSAFGSPVAGWAVTDIDGDGIPDLVVASLTPESNPSRYQPDGLSMWRNAARENSGPGRGYDIDGNWLGEKVTSRLFWAKGSLGVDGKLTFDNKKPVYYRHKGFSTQWRSWERERAFNVVNFNGQPTLLTAGDIDKIFALPISVKDGDIYLDTAVPLLETGPAVNETYFIHNITIMDKAADGTYRLLLDGNPGHLVVLEGKEAGKFKEVGSIQTPGGPVAVDTLAAPAREDWDNDGFADLIIGDSSGLLTLWRGTEDPLVYHAMQPLRVNGKVVQHQAGDTGSIQGPVERRWGYTQPTIGQWDGEGTDPVIIANDITGTLVCYRKDPNGASAADVLAPQVFTKDGETYPVAWRTRPAIIPARYNYKNLGLPVLLHIDWDGDLAVAIPEKAGSMQIARVEKLQGEDGKAIRLSGPAGLWGRTKLSISDWNGDGKWHLILGSSRETQNTFTDEILPGATPLIMENVGSNANPVLKHPESIRLKDGTALNFDIHNASVYPTVLSDKPGELPGIIVGAEDGKVYYFHRSELKN